MYGSRCHSVRRYRPRHRPHCVRWGPSSTPTGHSPLSRFSAHVCGGQTAGWIKMPLDTKVGLGAGHIVLCGDPAPHKKGHTPNFRPMSRGQTVAHLSYCWALVLLATPVNTIRPIPWERVHGAEMRRRIGINNIERKWRTTIDLRVDNDRLLSVAAISSCCQSLQLSTRQCA